ncbi:hypothetical protein A3I27_00700 [Candidatus Giovannonibacteria bacterium RIFCSPLOWO2_02_FULL_43_11b]|uniref:Uncharacterized protein n=1 Tax=Candidatus Giovannonibacteria bacterium RIFCSPHIGHO2_12_FULL_43_15 TaxID=1798341 RepID=A0A1F5WPR6_9BACT|nr:MAG: hypothetical protein A3B97_01390 [Candidatus Giovannonibacteria bacterium RIFCSPHIGHO2_02_FULL_43_32]OGF77594.1 MAG: hypothetical protein A3F23_00110 [Candidatus Giovannonibacteria bacterium RIFCSPHIGHO2_12_FULL_43_15]OGF79288.1 MAG: hypothetical protein A3A15_01460 [Candidatus Giovannonibacteria bacterium RIFCSPLOWO2_01_FULL_43_60]OGF90173.1 MAG: hypothetical protein A3I27_00700 [Candidatus Giovannonibacteria bacterium RIFCSPLOWO2_02_FULL_43_11b]OGF92567.1 MAG: hypothetical protein A3H
MGDKGVVGLNSQNQICNNCSRGVYIGSGRFVNRIPDLNDMETRVDNGLKFPEGDYRCEECDEKCHY